MKTSFWKTGELNGSNYVKFPMRSSVMLKIENLDKKCSIWSNLPHLHLCENDHPNRVSN